MRNNIKYIAFGCTILALGACHTTKAVKTVKPVEVTPPPVKETCVSINTLKKVVIPAVTKTGYSIVSIEGRTEQYYDEQTKTWKTITTPPIERKEPYTKIIEPEKIIYVDQDNREVTDICEKDLVEKPAPVQTEGQRPLSEKEIQGQLMGNTRTLPAETKPVEEENLPPVQ